ncbi:DUF389 domain-containing protein [Enterococcus raffinosus]|uniref:DUF389 domain-containing protein n=2 Tax=Enterococcus TaxID=1350 RepID=A0AAP5NDC6_9ENTE|nr:MULTISPECIES: DUF389 domain-containing protein [Enterococcus]SAZ81256.1 hypothetical protein DTPHA_1402546 [Enterococcus faecium]MBS6429837.1 DUF389 domain-containing protein [Enterococcus raffinosus]MDK7991228.1 DUF389 domain-containing protein [Enterococcus raffinosus]MDT2524462.1 DUF389 domain-containing protein [Enterococcus raffinosus]MDT2535134.1 DUF389 domain-containing protein [Enterococcus raffinosus]
MGKQEYTVDEFREKILFDIEIETSDSVILMCAILIASIGLNMNSLPVIFGAMLISPLMSPLLGVGYGLSVFDFAVVKKAAKLLLLEVVVSLAVATIYFSLSPITYASSEIIARTSPTIWDVIIAFAGGLAGIIGARKKGSNNIVPGVAIATALMPPACTVGYSIATKNLTYFMGASYLFIINCAFIVIATFLGIRFMRFPVVARLTNKDARKMNGYLILISLLIVIPSIFSASTLVRESIRKSAINQLVNEKFSEYVILNQTYDKEKRKLILTVSGERLPRSSIQALQKELPDYGLDNVTLEVDQVPNLSELDGNQMSKYLDQYFKNRIEQETDKNVESKKEQGTTDSQGWE